MKNILLALLIVFVSMTVHAHMGNPLKAGMPNTLTLPNGEVVYDLNGDWDAIYDTGGWGSHEDVVKITQKEKQFVGIYLLKGDRLVGKNQEKIRGEIRGNVIDEVFFYDVIKLTTSNLHWAPSKAVISEDGNKIVIKRTLTEEGATTNRTFTLKRKAQEKSTIDVADKIKDILLRPGGWLVEWRGTTGEGVVDFIFEARGENVVVKIHNATWNQTCERDVTITSDVIKLDGCNVTNISLLYDPNDHEYPFKGESQTVNYKFKAK